MSIMQREREGRKEKVERDEGKKCVQHLIVI